MALQKGVIPVGFNGLQTKIDSKTAPIGTFSAIDNSIMNKHHELVQRRGMETIGTNYTFSENIIGMYSVDREIGVITDASLYAFLPATDSYTNRGVISTPIVTAKPVVANDYTQADPCSAITDSGVLGVAWEDSRGGVRASVKDLDTNTTYGTVYDYSLDSTAIRPKVVGTASYLFFLYVKASGALVIRRYDPITQTLSTESTVAGSMGTGKAYDVIPFFNNILIVADTGGASPNAVYGYYWNVNTNTVGGPVNNLPSPVSLNIAGAAANLNCINIATYTQENYFSVTVGNSAANTVYSACFTSLLVKTAAGETQMDGSPFANTIHQVGTSLGLPSAGSSSRTLHIWLSTYDGSRHTSRFGKLTYAAGYGSAPSSATTQTMYRQMEVSSRPYRLSEDSDISHVILSYDSTLQSTYFDVRSDGAVTARLFTQVAGGPLSRKNAITNMYQRPDSDDTFVGALMRKTKVISAAGSYLTTTNIFTEQLFFSPYTIDTKALYRNLYLAGGFVKTYDGFPTIIEQGFHLYPEAPTSSTAGGSIPAGTYSYKIVWEWMDNTGQMIRSAPSDPLTVVLGGASDVTLTIRSLPITSKQTRFDDVRTNPVAAVYRTKAGGTTYYRVNQSVSTYVYNDPTALTISFVDSSTDTAIGSNSLLYTTGGVYPNIALPSTNLLTLAKNRIFVAGTDTEPNRVYFSKEKEEGVGVEFSDELSIIVDAFGGDITALAAMDDKVLIFKKSLVYYIAGQGPDKVGNGSFTIPQLVSADCGCNEPHSVVLTGKGIMFKSEKGIYLIDRQLQVTYIGQAVEAYNQDTVTSAVNLPDENHVLFTTDQNIVLVYDTFWDQWFTYSNISGIAAVVNDSVWYVADQSTNEVAKANPDQSYDYDGQAIIRTVATNWISLAGVEGFQRIYRVLIVGDNANLEYNLRANIYYDFEEYYSEQLNIAPYTNITTYGESSPYGDEESYGGEDDGTFQYEIRPARQKCTAIKIELLDSFPTGDRNDSFKLSEIVLVVGVKSSENKGLSPVTRRFISG